MEIKSVTIKNIRGFQNTRFNDDRYLQNRELNERGER